MSMKCRLYDQWTSCYQLRYPRTVNCCCFTWHICPDNIVQCQNFPLGQIYVTTMTFVFNLYGFTGNLQIQQFCTLIKHQQQFVYRSEKKVLYSTHWEQVQLTVWSRSKMSPKHLEHTICHLLPSVTVQYFLWKKIVFILQLFP